MNAYQMGQVAAFTKFAELGALAKAVLEHAGIGAATGGAMGGITGAIAAPEGQRLRGAGHGALAGGLVGGAIGAGGRAHAGNVEDMALRRANSPLVKGPIQVGPASEDQVQRSLDTINRGHHGLSGVGGALGGGLAGIGAAPNEPTMLEKIKAKLGLS